MAPSLHQVFLMVTDVDRSVEFYGDALGLAVTDRRERRAAFDSGECELVVERTFDAETLAAFGLEPPGDERGDGAIVVVEVDDVEAAHEAVVAGDAGEALFEPRTVEWGREMFLARDPDGYVVEVSRPVDEED